MKLTTALFMPTLAALFVCAVWLCAAVFANWSFDVETLPMRRIVAVFWFGAQLVTAAIYLNERGSK